MYYLLTISIFRIGCWQSNIYFHWIQAREKMMCRNLFQCIPFHTKKNVCLNSNYKTNDLYWIRLSIHLTGERCVRYQCGRPIKSINYQKELTIFLSKSFFQFKNSINHPYSGCVEECKLLVNDGNGKNRLHSIHFHSRSSFSFLLFILNWKNIIFAKKMYVFCACDGEYDYDYDDCHMNIQKFRLYYEHSIATNTSEFQTFFSFVHWNGHHFDFMAYNNRWPVWHTEYFALALPCLFCKRSTVSMAQRQRVFHEFAIHIVLVVH